MWFPEGVWNLSPNQPVLHLPFGIIEVAQKANAAIIPVAIEQYGKEFFVNIGEVFNCYCYIFCGQKAFKYRAIQSRLQLLFEPVLHAGSQQGFEILDGLLNLRFLSLDLLYALGKETLEGEGWERDWNMFQRII